MLDSPIVKLVFSWDRPLQLWGLVKSILDNTELKPEQIRCLCKSSDERYRALCDVVGAELGCKIVHQEKGLCESILELIRGAAFVSLAVDDMMYFRETSFAKATGLLGLDPNICLWSWRIGPDRLANDDLVLCNSHWVVPHAKTTMPYNYIFHTDGSLFRRKDLEYWINLIPKQERAWNLNHIEWYLAMLSLQARDPGGREPPLLLGGLHAGPPKQSCVTWAINKVSDFGSAAFWETGQTGTEQLRVAFESGARLDYSPLYGHSDWLWELGYGGPCHVPATQEAAELFATLVRDANHAK